VGAGPSRRSRAGARSHVDLPLDTGELLEKALERARDDEVLEIPDLVDTSWPVRQADAFINVLQGYLSGDTVDSSDNYLVTIHVDASALAGGDGRAAVPTPWCTRVASVSARNSSIAGRSSARTESPYPR
jgi:hypothetical protein